MWQRGTRFKPFSGSRFETSLRSTAFFPDTVPAALMREIPANQSVDRLRHLNNVADNPCRSHAMKQLLSHVDRQRAGFCIDSE